MPVYNGADFIYQAVDSVLKQSFTNFEFLIYDDGCTDNSIEIIKKFQDKRIKLFSDGYNKGIVDRLNFLIDQSRGQYIARMDADDIWYPNKLEEQMSFLKKEPENYMVACFVQLIDDKGEIFRNNFKQYSYSKDVEKFLPNSNFIIHSSVLLRREIFDDIGKYRLKYLHAEDYDLWLRMLKKKILFKILPNILMNYRFSQQSINSKYRRIQNKNVIFLKIDYYKTNGFKLFYLNELFRNIIYWVFPNWVWRLKRKIF